MEEREDGTFFWKENYFNGLESGIGMSMSWAAVRSWSSDCPGVGGMGFGDP